MTGVATNVPRPALFLDRDGTIIEEKHYLSRAEDVVLLPTAATAIAKLNSLGIPVVVATNQAGVARGLFAENCIHEVHARLDELLAAHGARIDRYEYCPNHPTEGVGAYRIDCGSRKPQPGMLTRAAAALDLDLARSCMIGDRRGDLEAGYRAGCSTALVRTGYGHLEPVDFEPASLRFLGAFDTLAEAVEAWLSQTGLEQILPVD